MTLSTDFGDIDIYVFDQLLRGRIAPGMRVMDAGCGGGRNLVYLLRQGYDVCGNDANPHAIAEVRALAAHLAPGGAYDFRLEAIEHTSFPDAHADVVIASAVLHFARNEAHFDAMLNGLWRVLRPGGLLVARLASTIGIVDQVQPLGGGRYLLPDGSERYLVDADILLAATARLGGVLADPIKTTVVHAQRAMTTWVVRRGDETAG
jgi:tellurite methyltransferase